MRKILLFFGVLLMAGMQLQAQTVYHAISWQVGSSFTAPPLPSPYPPYTVSSSGTTIVEAEYEIVIGPDCISYPTCSTSNNYFYTSGFDINTPNYFLARLVPPLAYAELKRQLDGAYCEVIGKKLTFKYVEKYTDGYLNYQIYDYQRNAKVAKPITLPALNLTKVVGDNYYILDLGLIPTLTGTTEQDSFYTLEVTNEKNEKTFLRFRYTPNE